MILIVSLLAARRRRTRSPIDRWRTVVAPSTGIRPTPTRPCARRAPAAARGARVLPVLHEVGDALGGALRTEEGREHNHHQRAERQQPASRPGETARVGGARHLSSPSEATLTIFATVGELMSGILTSTVMRLQFVMGWSSSTVHFTVLAQVGVVRSRASVRCPPEGVSRSLPEVAAVSSRPGSAGPPSCCA